MAEKKANKTQKENIIERALEINSDVPTSSDNLNILQTILNDYSNNSNQNSQESNSE